MDLDKIIGYIIQLLSVGTTAFVLFKALKIFPIERRGAELDNKEKEASVADSMEQLAERAASRALDQEKRIEELRHKVTELGSLQQEIEDLKAELENYKRENDELKSEIDALRCEQENYLTENIALRRWAEDLVSQLRNADIAPVKMKPVAKRKC